MNTPEYNISARYEAIKSSEKLTDNEIGNLLAALGNSEAKAMTLLLMQPAVIYRRYDIHRVFMHAQGETPGWKTSKILQFQYCGDSFSPIGLVTRETLDENANVYAYQITDFGQEVGKPLAALLLDFSKRHDISLYGIFGSTHSKYSESKDDAPEGQQNKKGHP